MAENVFQALIIDIKEVGAAVAGGEIARLGGTIKKTDEAADKATRSHGRLRTALGGLKSIAGTTAAAIGATGLAAGLGESVKNAIAFQRAQAQLGNAIHTNVRKPAEGATEELSKYGDALSMRGGFMPWQNVGAMAQFVRITGSTTKAMKDLSLATDIARGTHRSFQQASQAVMMVENGRATALRRLGIAISPVTTATDRLRDAHIKTTSAMRERAKEEDKQATRLKALDILQHRFAGATATYSKTAEGAMGNFRNAIEVLSTKLGAVLLPAITKVFNALSKFVTQMMEGKGAGGQFVAILKTIIGYFEELWKWIKANSTVLEILGGAILGVVVALRAMLIIETVIKLYKMWQEGTLLLTVAQWALNAALMANPIGLVVVAIGAIIGALVVAYLKIHAFRQAVNAVWAAIKAAWGWLKGAAVAVINFVIHHWRTLILAIGPLGVVIDVVSKHFQFFKNIAIGVFNAIYSAAKWVVGAITTVWNTLTGILSKPFQVAKTLISTAINGILTAIRWVVDKISALLGKIVGPIASVAGKIGGVVGTLTHTGGKVAKFLGFGQAGGLVTTGGPFMVGERGPEIVTLPRGAHITPNDALPGVRGGEERPIIIYNILDGKVLSKSVVRQGLLQASRG